MSKIDEALEKETLSQIENMAFLDDGTEEKRRATEQVKNLVEAQNTLESTKIDKRNKIAEIGSKLLLGLGSLALGVVTSMMCFQFEETGSVTGFASRNIINRNQNMKL